MPPRAKLPETPGARLRPRRGHLNAALALKGCQEDDVALSPRGPIIIDSCSLGGTNVSFVLSLDGL
jgi:hypothetical protein